MTSDTTDDLMGVRSDELPQFASVMRGYDRGQVDDFVSRLQDFLGDAERRAERAERAAAESGRRIERLTTELRQALDRPTAAQTPYDGLGERIESMIRLAGEEGEAIRARAAEDAERLTAAARQQREAQTAAAEQELARVAERRQDVVSELRRVQDALATLGLRAAPVDDLDVSAPPRQESGAADGSGHDQAADVDPDATTVVNLNAFAAAAERA